MSRRRKLLVGTVALAVIGAAVWSEIQRAERGIPVRVEAVESRHIAATITTTGQVRARRQVNISSDVMGRVTDVTVVDGDQVQEGQVLLTVDPRQFRAAVSRAQAALSQAEAEVAQQHASLLSAERNLARLRGIVERNADLVSRQALDEAETAVAVQEALVRSAFYGAEQAEAGLEESEDQLSRTTIRAPISGRVIRLSIEEGETAVIGTMNNPGSLLLTIGDLSVIEAVMTVDETDVLQISVGDSAVVELDALPGKLFSAWVSSIGNSAIQNVQGAIPAANTGGADFEVILTLVNPPPELRPDLSATADIIVEERDDVLAVPIISVTVRSNEYASDRDTEPEDRDAPVGPLSRSPDSLRGEGVFVVRDGVAIWTPVALGVTGQEHFEIRSGVSEGDVVVSGPYRTIQGLEDGDDIRLLEDGSSDP